MTYDDNSNVTALTEVELSDAGVPPAVFLTTFEYDALDRRTAGIDNVGARSEVAYDSLDLVVRTRDPLGNVVRYGYDGLGRLVRTERDLTSTGTGGGTVVSTQVETRAWDDSSRFVSLTDANGNTTTGAFDSHDRPITTTFADGTSITAQWDVHGNLVQSADATGSVQTVAYDRLGRMLSRNVARGPDVAGTTAETYRYDGMSRLVRAQDDDSLVTFGNDSLSNVSVESQRHGSGPLRAVTSSSDGAGNLTSLTDSSGSSVTYVYDPLDRVKLVLEFGSIVAAYDYAGPDRLVRVTRANGIVTDTSYDAARRITRDQDNAASCGVNQTFTYSWNLKLSRSDATSGTAHEYGYDSLYRLTRSTRTALGLPPSVVEYTLDAAGNRLFVAGGSDAGPYTMDATLPEPADFQVHQYTTTPRGPRSYDRSGNAVVLDAGSPSTRTLSYDFRDQVCSVLGSGVSTEYGIDALGRRVSRSGSSGPGIEWVHGSPGELQQLAGGVPQWTMTYGANAGLERLREAADLNGNGALDTYFLHRDDLGNVVAASDAAGVVVERYDYDDFGRPRFYDCAGGTLPGSLIGNPFLFRGWRYDAATGLYHDGALSFDPDAGRLTSRVDPANTPRMGPATNPWSEMQSPSSAFVLAGPGNGMQNPSTPTGDASSNPIPGVGIVVKKGNGRGDSSTPANASNPIPGIGIVVKRRPGSSLPAVDAASNPIPGIGIVVKRNPCGSCGNGGPQ